MISFWMYNIQNRLAHQVRGNPTAERKHTDFVRRIEYLIWKIPVAPFFAVNPWILYVFCAVFSAPGAALSPFVDAASAAQVTAKSGGYGARQPARA